MTRRASTTPYLRAKLFFAAAALLALTSAALALPQQAYVWQRQWSPELVTALDASRDRFAGWRVLVAETDAPGRLRAFDVAWKALAATGRPVVAVVRIDGHLPIAHTILVEEVSDLVRALIVRGAARIGGIEIDYDCGAERLDDYAQFLEVLRRTIPKSMTLSITALPAWLGYPALDRVLGAADEVVLQVHAVRAPSMGLFDPKLARRWIDALDAVDTKPFLVALPDYGTRVVRDPNGAIVAVESETPRLMGDNAAEELIAVPSDVAVLVRALEQEPPRHFVGLVWFRLPLASDRRTWDLSTLTSVMRGESPTVHIDIESRTGAVPGLTNLVLVNRGDVDGVLPARAELPPHCTLADGVNGYALVRGTEYSLVRLQMGLLRAHHEQAIGWMRCRGAVRLHAP